MLYQFLSDNKHHPKYDIDSLASNHPGVSNGTISDTRLYGHN